MALLKTTPHLHVFEKSATRNKDWRKQVFRCVDPDCSYYNKAEFILGKRARCHECKADIIVEKAQIENAVIVGLCCSKSHRAQKWRQAQTATKAVIDAMFEPKVELNQDPVDAIINPVPFAYPSNPFGDD